MSQYPPHFKRPVVFVNGLETRAASSFLADATFRGGNVVLSTAAGIVDHIQALTGKSTGTRVNNYGVTQIIMASGTESATAAKLIYTIDNPIAGIRKRIYVQADATEEIEVRTASSLTLFLGSTFNALLWSTNGASTSTPPVVDLYGASTSQWVLATNLSTVATKVVAAGATA